MTYSFQTDNIFYVPPGKPFRVYDLLGWRRIDFHVQSTRVRLDASVGPAIREGAERALKQARALDEPPDMPTEEARMRDFLQQLPFAADLRASTGEIQEAFLPLRPTFWVRLSQGPMESFFHEDYEETPLPDPSGSSVILSCLGAVAFNAIGEAECELPSDEPYSLCLSAPANSPAIQVTPLDPFEPLPLVREYCGHLGSSNRAEMVTIDLHGKIPEASMAAIPIRRTGSVCYETLYLHIPLATEISPLRPFRSGDSERLAGVLDGKGFEPRRRTKRFGIWIRGEDVIQVYRDLLGKESESVPAMPPFCVAAWARGSTDCAARCALLKEIFGQ